MGKRCLLWPARMDPGQRTSRSIATSWNRATEAAELSSRIGWRCRLGGHFCPRQRWSQPARGSFRPGFRPESNGWAAHPARMFDAVTILASSEGGVCEELVGGPFKELSFAQIPALLEEDDRYLGIDLDAELPLWRAEAESLDRPTFAYVVGVNKVPLLPCDDGRLRVVRSCHANLGGPVDRVGDG